MVGGWDANNNRIKSAEIINLLDSTSSNCRKPVDYPLNVFGSIGTYIGGKSLVCGGSDEKRSECFGYRAKDRVWKAAGYMTVGRYNAASVRINQTHWLIMGGLTPSGKTAKTEMYEEGKGFKVSVCPSISPVMHDLKILFKVK